MGQILIYLIGTGLWGVFVALMKPPGTSRLEMIFLFTISFLAIHGIAIGINFIAKLPGKEKCEDRMER